MKKKPTPKTKKDQPAPRTISRRTYRLVSCLLILTGLACILWGTQLFYNGKVAFGTHFLNQSLAGLTPAQAADTIRQSNETILTQPIILRVGPKEYQTFLLQLGYQVDTEATVKKALASGQINSVVDFVRSLSQLHHPTTITPEYSHNTDILNAFIAKVKAETETEVQDMSLDYQNNAITTTPPEIGFAIDSQAVANFILSQETPAHIITPADLPVTQTNPDLTQETEIASARQLLEKLLVQSLTLKADEVTTTLDPSTLFSFVILTKNNHQLAVDFDETKVRKTIDDFAKKITITPQPKTVSSTDNSVLTEGRDGRKIDADAATTKLMDQLRAANTSTLTFETSKVERKTVTQSPGYELNRMPGKYIEVDLSMQLLTTIEGDHKIASYRVSTGKWSTPTPIGEFTIHNHAAVAKSARFGLFMPRWMDISGDGQYGIHGLPYWPDGHVEGTSHIGTPVSHGCIRLGPGDDQTVYDWAANGTPVIIHQ